MSSKQREALSEIIDLIDKWRNDGVMEHWQYSQLFDVADNALAEPLKNCEVGSAEQQGERCLAQFEQWKRKFQGKKIIVAIMEWAHMPYESEVK